MKNDKLTNFKLKLRLSNDYMPKFIENSDIFFLNEILNKNICLY